MALLPSDTVFALIDVAVRAQAPRTALLTGLPPGYTSLLTDALNPRAQAMLDLNHLNQHPQIVGYDGTPLVQWLRNLAMFISVPADRRLVEAALTTLGHAPAAVVPDPEPTPEPAQPDRPPRVFISYTHAPAGHAEKVLALATRLVGDGVDVRLDQWENRPGVVWPTWMQDQVEAADVVVVVCNAEYAERFKGKAHAPGPGGGVAFEGVLLTNTLMVTHGRGGKFVPVVFSDAELAHVPTVLAGFSKYVVPLQYEALYALLTNQTRQRPQVGRIRRPAHPG